MARNRGSQVVGMVALGGLTIALGAALGYFVIGGARQDHAASDAPGVQEASAPPPFVVAPKPPPHPLVHVQPNSDYTAPGAPRIHIVEDRSPTLDSPSHRHAAVQASDTTTATDIPTPDVEASQQGLDDGTTTSGTAGTPAPADSPTSPDTSPTATVTDPEAPQAGTTPDSPAGPAASPAPDPEAGQTGTIPAPIQSSQHAQYRVQAGSFGSAQDAQDYVNTLQGKGLDASVSPQRQGDQTVYKVQVGAYHDRSAAEQAASDMRRRGVPVTVAPISP